jgi:serine/threonine protein kinase
VREYALTLAGLAAKGIGHRDLKPENLFRHEGRWVIGDFGLATYPGKEPITVGERRLGPLYFIAPEMLREPDVADAGPADVYSLAKTLWALASGQRYPPEGQIRVDVADHDLGQWTGGGVFYTVRDPRMFQLLEVSRQILTSSLTESQAVLGELAGAE